MKRGFKDGMKGGSFQETQERSTYVDRTEKPVHINQENKLTFGKHRGRTIEWIEKSDPNYLNWARENIAGFKDVCPAKPKSKSKRSRVKQLNIKSSSGHGGIVNKGFRPPIANRFRKHIPSQ